MSILLAILCGYALDLLLGDPHWLPHPVRWIGALIGRCESLIRPLCGGKPNKLRFGGSVTVLVVVLVSTALPAFLLWITGHFPPLQFALKVWMCYQILAINSLQRESMAVSHRITAGDLPGARTALSRIVGRDTDHLTEPQIARAVVETVAENTGDGVVAPLFYLAVGGPVLGFCYKAINTLDSMLGYKDSRYLDFGRFAARLDDAANWLPARLAALCMVVAAGCVKQNRRNSWRIFCRDRFNHPSPNSAQTESACAGALGIRLGGPSSYGGVTSNKPYIGDSLRDIEAEDIRRANRLMHATALLALVLFSALRLSIILLLGNTGW